MRRSISRLDRLVAAGLASCWARCFDRDHLAGGSVFVDEVADHVSANTIRRNVRHGAAFRTAMTEGIKTALLTIPGYLVALPFVFIAGAGFTSSIATACIGPNISSSRRCGFAPPRKPRRAQNAAIIHRRACDRSVRVDPDRQPGDAAVRSVHGSHAQAAFRSAAGIDRAGAEDERAGGVILMVRSASSI